MEKQQVAVLHWLRLFLFLFIILWVVGSVGASEQKVVPKDVYLKLVAKHIRLAMGDGHQVLKYVDAMTGFYGDKVNFSMEYDPSAKGVFKGSERRADELKLFQFLLEKLPDYHQENTDVQVDGDSIIVKETMVATLPTGKVSRSPIMIKFTFGNDGKITDQHDTWKPEDNTEINKLLKEMPSGGK